MPGWGGVEVLLWVYANGSLLSLKSCFSAPPFSQHHCGGWDRMFCTAGGDPFSGVKSV